MDPDAIFIIMLWFSLLILTIAAAINLLKKIWRSGFALAFKILLTPIVIFPLVFGIMKINTVEVGPPVISIFDIIIYSASFIIALNWSINIARKLVKRNRPVSPYLSIPVLIIFFTLLIPFAFLQIGQLFDRLNLLGSGG